MNIFSDYLTQVLLLLILALASFLGVQARNLYRKFVTTEIKQSVCRTAVRFVEQVYIDLHGPEKLAQAMLRASEILKSEYGIQISDSELIAMIEAAVNEFNNAFGKIDTKGRHEELPQEEKRPEPVRIPDPETGGTATLQEIIADLKDVD